MKKVLVKNCYLRRLESHSRDLLVGMQQWMDGIRYHFRGLALIDKAAHAAQARVPIPQRGHVHMTSALRGVANF